MTMMGEVPQQVPQTALDAPLEAQRLSSSTIVAIQEPPNLDAPVSLVEIVAYLTSHRVMDYTAMSDFFLTFRVYASPFEVLEMLFARIWSAFSEMRAPTAETGRDTAVRTFVVLRHWVNNFFADDFLPNYELRLQFVEGLTELRGEFAEGDATAANICQQLAKAWLKRVTMFWESPQGLEPEVPEPPQHAETPKEAKETHGPSAPSTPYGTHTSAPQLWPLHAGGQFGTTDLDQPDRRRTILSFYEPQAPAAALLRTSHDSPRELGSIIRGGILVSTNPAVSCIRTSPKKHKVRFFGRARASEPTTLQLEGPKVDLLQLAVMNEIKALIAARESMEPANGAAGLGISSGPVSLPAPPSDDGPLPPALPLALPPTDPPALKPAFASTPQSSFRDSGSFQDTRATVDTLNIGQVLDDTSLRSEGSGGSEEFVDLRRSGVNGGLLDDISFDRASYVSFSSLSTVSLARDSTASLASARERSGSNPSYMSRASRASNVYGAPYGPGAPYGAPAASASSISLLSELSTGYEMAPCAGFNNRVAAELAAIPDDSGEEDAMLIAIQKLEGTYKPKHETNKIWMNALRSVPSFTSGDSKLYSQAFASVRGVSGLAIPQCSTPKSGGGTAGWKGTFTGSSGLMGLGISTRSSSETLKAGTGPTTSSVEAEHVPFVLSLSADTLAEQMTLLEKDALDQVDWKELAEIQWSQDAEIHSWLEFLASSDPRGVDVVTHRFNLVLGWIKSEIVLCRQASLQARTITRFIHVAAECRRLQNYATLFQVVLALTSDVLRVRVATAWSLVDKRDLSQLQSLEELVSPLRNFRNLRAAHRAMDYTSGCVPFTGLFLADLLFNNEKPNLVDGKINFPKFKTTSAITRSLLECIEWSHNYRILPKPEILSKCLYLQSLTSEQLKHI